MQWLILYLLPISASALLNSLRQVAGVYRNNSDSQLGNTVLITACNFGYLNHFMNFKCFMDRLRFKYLVVAMDERSYEVLKKIEGVESYFWASGAPVARDSTLFRSKAFNIISARKMEITLAAMKLGFDVIFTDPDVAIIQDPIRFLNVPMIDYVHSVNKQCPMQGSFDYEQMEGNTGFYFVRSNNKTISLWEQFLVAVPKQPTLDDQTIFWETIRHSKEPLITSLHTCLPGSANRLPMNPQTLVMCPLDECMFNSGMISIENGHSLYGQLLEEIARRNSSVFSVHANWMLGNEKKREALHKHGLWLSETTHLNPERVAHHRCRPYMP